MIAHLEPTRSGLLEQITRLLDIPNHLMEKALARYGEVAAWLGAQDSELLEFNPLFVPQGSMKLGTVVRPVIKTDEYDLDSVCRLWIPRERISQKDLKDLVGSRLAKNSDFEKILIEGRRCWTLNFEEKFHMDILPAIPNLEGAEDSLLITDQQLYRWQHSHPIGYADWFKNQMNRRIRHYAEALERMAKAQNMRVEDIPEWKVKTPLQRVVQILKRHRDIHFGDDQDKPISIIITTLAARTYDGSSDLETALLTVLENMDNWVEKRGDEYWVENPVDKAENFADKWKQHPQRKQKFDDWLRQARQDFNQVRSASGVHKVAPILEQSLGRDVVVKALSALGQDLLGQRQVGALKMSTGTGTLGTVSGAASAKPVLNHDFYGEDEA